MVRMKGALKIQRFRWTFQAVLQHILPYILGGNLSKHKIQLQVHINVVFCVCVCVLYILCVCVYYIYYIYIYVFQSLQKRFICSFCDELGLVILNFSPHLWSSALHQVLPEMFLGSLLGTAQSLSRVSYCSLIPPGFTYDS